MFNEANLIEMCRSNNRTAQRMIFDKYAGKMRGVCLRYVNDKDDVEDILIEGFMKVFSQIKKYSGSGSFEGWIRKIMVYTAIAHYRKNKVFADKKHRIEDKYYEIQDNSNEEVQTDILNAKSELEVVKHAEFSQEELLIALNSIDESFRLVFNLFHFENYSHKEISAVLSIDEKTSRTRLFRAKKLLRESLYQMSLKKIGVTQTHRYGREN